MAKVKKRIPADKAIDVENAGTQDTSSPPAPPVPTGKLKKRPHAEWAGLIPIYNPKTDIFASPEKLDNLPKSIHPEDVAAYIDRIIDYFLDKDLWITNAGLKHLCSAARLYLNKVFEISQVQQGLYKQTWEALIETREEPVEYSTAYREAEFNRCILGTSDTPPPAGINGKSTQKGATQPATITTTREGHTVAEGGKGGKRFKVLDLPVTAVLRYLAFNGWSKKEITEIMQALELPVAPATITAQYGSGVKGNAGQHGKIPELNQSQKDEVEAWAVRIGKLKVTTTTAKKTKK